MKKTINFTIIFVTVLSLTFILTTQVNAAKKVTLTYYAGKGYFKSESNQSRHKILIKNRIYKKRGYAPAIRREGYVFNGWYTQKKGGIKYTSSKKITKSIKLYAHWVKKYKVNTNYFVPIGMKCNSLSDYEPYWGNLKIIKMKKGSFYYNYTFITTKLQYYLIIFILKTNSPL